MPRGWEGNRRSGVALAMRHGLKWFIHLWAQRLRVGDEHSADAPTGAWLPLPFKSAGWLAPLTASSAHNGSFCYAELTVSSSITIRNHLL